MSKFMQGDIADGRVDMDPDQAHDQMARRVDARVRTANCRGNSTDLEIDAINRESSALHDVVLMTIGMVPLIDSSAKSGDSRARPASADVPRSEAS